MDLVALKEQTRAMWSAGDYAKLAEFTEQAAGPLVDACAVSAGQEVLDVGAGTGNVAVLAAREGAKVVASDLTPALVEQGRARTTAEDLDVEWVVADAEELPFADESFECVTSCFGAMFAPRPEQVARELFRVVRPGGTVGLASWTPDGYHGRSFALAARYRPPPDGVPAPTAWGDEAMVRSRLDGLAASIVFERRVVRITSESPEAMDAFFTEHAGSIVMARRALPPERYAAMLEEGRHLRDAFNAATDGSVILDSEYLLAVARRRG